MILDIYCDKCQYLLGDKIGLIIESNEANYDKYSISVKHLNIEILRKEIVIKDKIMMVELGEFGIGGYEVCIGNKYTAFDVVNNTKDSLRYGFLSEFYERDIVDVDDIKQLNKYHINIVQFYDWMYRHHDLIPKENVFVDPLGRKLYKSAIDNKIKLCHKYGMKAIAYGAVYGAEKEYFEKFPEQLLYKNTGEKFDLIDIIGIMNISANCPWHKHIIEEFKKVLTEMDFDGIHLDQYGFPKTAISGIDNKVVYLNEAFPKLINATKRELEKIKDESIVIFNCVNNWPIEDVAKTEQDAIYIEVWEPNDKYWHLANLIKNARILASNKNVILAAYIHPFNEAIDNSLKETAALLTMAVIFSNGGYHLMLGEKNGALAEAYYVNYGKYRTEFENILRSYYDFIVKYKELLYSSDLEDISMTYANGINGEVIFKGSNFSSDYKKDTISVVLKQNKRFKVINFINLIGIEDELWNKGKNSPIIQKDILCTYIINEEVEGVYFASPDIENGITKQLPFNIVSHSQGNAIEFIIPQINIWSMVYIKIRKDN